MNADRVKKLLHISMTANYDEIKAAKAWVDEQERLLELAEKRIAELEAESEGRRKALEAKAEEARREWIRAENAESEKE